MSDQLAIEHIRDPRPGRTGYTWCGQPCTPTPPAGTLARTCEECARSDRGHRAFQIGSSARLA